MDTCFIQIRSEVYARPRNYITGGIYLRSLETRLLRNASETKSNRANPNPVLHETDILVEISTKRGTTGGEKCGKNLEKSAYQIQARSIFLGKFSREILSNYAIRFEFKSRIKLQIWWTRVRNLNESCKALVIRGYCSFVWFENLFVGRKLLRW